MSTAHVRNIEDADLTGTIALPASAGTVNSTSVDLGAGVHVAGAELLINVPVLTTTELPNAETDIHTLESSADDSTFAAVLVLGTQTGAGGAGAAAAEYRHTPKSTGARYWRVSTVTSTTAGDQTGKSTTIKVVV